MIPRTNRRFVISLTILVLLAASFNPSMASSDRAYQAFVDYPFPVSGWEFIDQIGGRITAVAIQGSMAYISQGFSLAVIDISNPSQPVEVSMFPLRWTVDDIALSESYAYVVSGHVYIFDIRDEKNPVLAGQFDPGSMSHAIQIIGSKAYLVSASGVDILDITDPVHPERLSTYHPANYATDVFVVGDLAYVLDTSLEIVDITDPYNPQKLGSAGYFYFRGNLWGYGSYAYVASGSGFFTIDVSMPSNPQIVWEYGPVYDFKVAGNYGFAAAESSGLYVFDMSNPATPQLIGRSPQGGTYDSWKIDVSGTIVAAASRDKGLQIFDVKKAAEPVIAGTYTDNAFDSAYATASKDGFLYITSAQDLTIFDLKDPEKPVLRSQTYFLISGSWLQVENGRAYTLDGGRLITIDVSDPDHPALLGGSMINGDRGIDIRGNRAYDVHCTNDLYDPPSGVIQVWDIADPNNTVELATYQTKGCASDVEIVGNLAYLVSYDQYSRYLQILDISDLAQISQVGLLIDNQLGSCLTVADGLAYVTNYDGDLTILEVNDPAAPLLLSRVTLGLVSTEAYVHPPLVKDSLVYLVSNDPLSLDLTIIHVFDVSDPIQPYLHSSVQLPYSVSGVERIGHYLYLTRDGMADDLLIFRQMSPVYLPLVTR